MINFKVYKKTLLNCTNLGIKKKGDVLKIILSLLFLLPSLSNYL